MMRRVLPALGLLTAAALIAGCAHYGPHTISRDGFDYNRAIVDASNQQLLLNLVRMRYNDPWLFLSVGSVVAQYEVKGSADVAPVFGNGAGLTGAAADVGVGYSERPTISYTPITGSDFAKDMLTPVRPEILFLLSNMGWEIKSLLVSCVDGINGLKNARGGPTWMFAPNAGSFSEFLETMQVLQRADAYSVRVVKEEKEQWRVTFELLEPKTDDVRRAQDRFRQLLGLDPKGTVFSIHSGIPPAAPDEIKVQTRSLLGVYYFFAQLVEVPEEDVAAHRVLVTKNADGSRYDWSQLVGKLFKVRSQKDEPPDAFIKVRHRGSWFYIADDDPFSKQTYALLNTMTLLQATSSKGASPLLTISAGP